MQGPGILYPIFALAAWTFVVLSLIPIARFRSAFRGEVGPGDFRYGESSKVPLRVSLPNRNYTNLTESPLFFYIVCLLLFVSGGGSEAAITTAWAYVGLRVMHSIVH